MSLEIRRNSKTHSLNTNENNHLMIPTVAAYENYEFVNLISIWKSQTNESSDPRGGEGVKRKWLGKKSMKKKVFFQALPESPKPPPDPNSGNLVLFFGRQNSRFESQFRTKNTIYTI